MCYTIIRKLGSGYEKANSERSGGAKPCVQSIGIGRLANNHFIQYYPREGLSGFFYDFFKKCQAYNKMCQAQNGKSDNCDKKRPQVLRFAFSVKNYLKETQLIAGYEVGDAQAAENLLRECSILCYQQGR
jgi:hypothetical protein